MKNKFKRPRKNNDYSQNKIKLNKKTPHKVKSAIRNSASKGGVNKALREIIFERDGHKCVYCGSKEDLTIDHKVPVSKGGKTIKYNLVTACRKCNQMKSCHQVKFIKEWAKLVK